MSADGIGAYFSPEPLRPVNPPQPIDAPVQHTSGLGSYYSPAPLRPVNPPQPIDAPLQVQGLGDDATNTKAAIGFLFVIVLGYWLLRGKS